MIKSGGEFKWTSQEQGAILGAFYYGILGSMLVGGYLTERYNGKWVLFTSLLGGSICALLIPAVARGTGKAGFMALRVIQGLFAVTLLKCKLRVLITVMSEYQQGPLLSGVIALCSFWIPPRERSWSVSFVFGGKIV